MGSLACVLGCSLDLARRAQWSGFMNKTTFQKVLAELANAFETRTRTRTRDDGTTYTCLKDDAPAWLAGYAGTTVMHDIHAAVDDRFPDDWIYASIAGMADTMTGYDAADADDMRENVHEIADGMVDVYNCDRSAWLAMNLNNAALCDEACSELGCDPDAGMFTRIGLGQYLALTRIGEAIISACESEADERDAAGDEDGEA